MAGGDDGARSAAPRDRAGEAISRRCSAIADEHGGTRAAGTPGDRATGAYLAERLRAAGYRVRTQPFRVPFYASSARRAWSSAGAA